MTFGVWCMGFGIRDFGSLVERLLRGPWFRVEGLGFVVWGSGFGVWGLG